MKYIYFIKPIDRDGPIKIGSSINYHQRLAQINLWSPIPLELIGAIAADCVCDESHLHRCLADAHSHGEWFHPTPKVLEAVAGILKHGISYIHNNLHPVGFIRSQSNRNGWKTRRERLSGSNVGVGT